MVRVRVRVRGKVSVKVKVRFRLGSGSGLGSGLGLPTGLRMLAVHQHVADPVVVPRPPVRVTPPRGGRGAPGVMPQVVDQRVVDATLGGPWVVYVG